MNWSVVVVFAYIMVALELALGRSLALGQTGVAPSFLLAFVAFVALHAPAMHALWLALALGVVMDLTATYPAPGGFPVVYVLGPMALGYLAAAYVVLTLRGLVVRRNPLTLIVLAVLAAAVAHVVAAALLSMRSMYDPLLFWQPLPELVRRLFCAAYTAAPAAAMAFLLMPLSGLFGFHDPHGRRHGRRAH